MLFSPNTVYCEEKTGSFNKEKLKGTIVFASDRGGNWDIWSMKANGTGVKQLTKDAHKDSDPKWSPDGKEIMCLKDFKIVFIDMAGNITRTLTTQKIPTSAIWATSGKQIYYTAYTSADESATSAKVENIYQYDLLNNRESQITDFLMPAKGYRPIYDLAASPDGKTLAIVTTPFVFEEDPNDGPFAVNIYTINTSGTDLKLLVKKARDPAWSPNGALLAYTAGGQQPERDVHEKIFVYDFETQKSSQLTNGIWEDRYPVFSPDGTKIAFSSGRHRFRVNGRELFVINIDGTGEARITPIQINPDGKFKNHFLYGWATDTEPDWTS